MHDVYGGGGGDVSSSYPRDNYLDRYSVRHRIQIQNLHKYLSTDFFSLEVPMDPLDLSKKYIL
jgi:hypothetical protein